MLLLVILFGIAMTPPGDAPAVDDQLIGFAVDTVLQGVGPDPG